MRTIRASTISIIAIGLLAGSTVGVAAQDEDANSLAPALTSGAFVFTDDDPISWEETLKDGIQTEAWVDSADVELSDSRLSGAITLDYTKQRFDTRATDIAWGTARIENDAGAWEGTMRRQPNQAHRPRWQGRSTRRARPPCRNPP